MPDNRYLLNQFPGLKVVKGSVSIGASGAPTIGTFPGLTSITRNGAGDYTLVFDRTYNAFRGAFCSIKHTSLHGLQFQVHSDDLRASTPYVRITFGTTVSPAAAHDPPSGCQLWVAIYADTIDDS